MPDLKISPLGKLCPRCYRQPREEPPFEWCARCISSLAIIAECDQAEAADQHEFSVFDWRAWLLIASSDGAYVTQEEMP